MFKKMDEKGVKAELDQKVIDKAEKIIKDAETNPEDFRDLYGNTNVDRDTAYVKEMEQRFKKEDDPNDKEILNLATVFEAILYDQGEQSNWLGSKVTTVKTARYDDIKNHVDMIAEFEEDRSASHLGLAIDATSSTHEESKFKCIKKEIDTGKLTQVKYFKSENIGFRGQLFNIPRVVIGVEAKTVRELSRLWLEGKNKELGAHPVQFQILEEILIQLETFERYAKSVKRDKAAMVYKKAKEQIAGIYREKLNGREDRSERDSVFEEIKREMELFN